MKPVVDLVLKDTPIPDTLKFTDTSNLKPTSLVPIRDGHIFKLGSRDIKVISVPGHTPGSICLMDEKQKLLFTGDNNNPEVWLFFEESLPVSIIFKVSKNWLSLYQNSKRYYPVIGLL